MAVQILSLFSCFFYIYYHILTQTCERLCRMRSVIGDSNLQYKNFLFAVSRDVDVAAGFPAAASKMLRYHAWTQPVFVFSRIPFAFITRPVGNWINSCSFFQDELGNVFILQATISSVIYASLRLLSYPRFTDYFCIFPISIWNSNNNPSKNNFCYHANTTWKQRSSFQRLLWNSLLIPYSISLIL